MHKILIFITNSSNQLVQPATNTIMYNKHHREHDTSIKSSISPKQLRATNPIKKKILRKSLAANDYNCSWHRHSTMSVDIAFFY